MNIPILSDLTKQISRDYGVLLEGPGIALRWGMIADSSVMTQPSLNQCEPYCLPLQRKLHRDLMTTVRCHFFCRTSGSHPRKRACGRYGHWEWFWASLRMHAEQSQLFWSKWLGELRVTKEDKSSIEEHFTIYFSKFGSVFNFPSFWREKRLP